MRRGFTMIEIIIVLAVLAILLAIATPNYQRWRASVQVQQMAQQLAQDISKQRSEARRTNTSKTLTVASNQYSLNGNTITMPSTISLTPDASTSLTFAPPYGSSGSPLRTFTLTWKSNTSIERKVRVVGVMGKVIIQ
jgi:type IV pilus assembly protein PilA